MTPLLRRYWLTAHRWIAITLGSLLAFASLLGALLAFARPLDQALNPQLFAQPAGEVATVAPLAAVAGRLQQEFGPGTGYTFRPPRLPGDTLWVVVRGNWEGIVYFDAAGRELGRRGEHEGWFNLLFELHSSLLLGDTGKGLLTAAAAAYVILLASGLVLWWPRQWPPSFRIARGAGWLRTWLDLHKVFGSLLGVVLLVSVASGAYMAWPPLRELVSSAAGERPTAPPPVPAVPAGTARVPLDRLVAIAQVRFPQAMVGYIHVSAKTTQAVRVRLKTADDPHPNGLSSVWLHPVTGEVLKVARWNELDTGARIITTMYPLHTGALGGMPHLVLTALAGLVLATLGFSGLALWWKRRGVRRAGATRAARGGQAA